MCGMAENRLLWPIEKHWLNVRFLNGSWFSREFVRATVEARFNSLLMGIRFYFNEAGEIGKADIRIKFSNTLSYSHAGTNAKLVRWSRRPTTVLDSWSRERVLRNYAPHSPEGKTLEPYDPKSVMHYVVQKGDDLLGKETGSINVVLLEGDNRMPTLLYPPREEGMFKPPGDNSENNTPRKRKGQKRLVKQG
ncbi:hypothetical protein BHE90_005779 [Fusarium euwallaceae]|uniref:Uncharacterized protein n=1 Tax=Fusarium euwallaceae TaxID=1147111 RepID=A0A430LVH9_9HYPO|nr:hypothetical protein BHE90_005779 [Fusarium euwallaceae]